MRYKIAILSPLPLIALFFTLDLFRPSNSYPGSGIVVDRGGHVYISDLSRGLLKIDLQGKVTTLQKDGGQWLAIDENGSFGKVNFNKSTHAPNWFKKKTLKETGPALITDSGSPFILGQDGNIYFACLDSTMLPGRHQIGKLTPEGHYSLLNPKLAKMSEENGNIQGIAQGPDGSIYISYPKAILKLNKDGSFSNIMNPSMSKGCVLNVAADDAPFLTGLAVDLDGTIYVAATGCGCIFKIAGDFSKITSILKSESPWAPSGIALHNGDLYVLEHKSPTSSENQGWQPRVRKLSADKKILTLATIE